MVSDAAALFVGFASGSGVLETDALFVIVPAAVDVSVRVTVADPPEASAPRVQVTGPVPLHVPADGVALTKVPGPVHESVSVTLLAVDGPALLTVNVITAFWPCRIDVDAALCVAERSALGAAMTSEVGVAVGT
jgi:hypothetical protein